MERERAREIEIEIEIERERERERESIIPNGASPELLSARPGMKQRYMTSVSVLLR